MAELLQRFSGNPFATIVGQKIEHATDASLTAENWALNMEICDMINDTDEGPRDAVRAIKKRLQQNAGKNFTIVSYTLTILEACVKNCGKRFHILVTNKDFIQDLVKLIGPKNDPPPAVQEKVLSLIQSWAVAFRGQNELSGVVQVYNELKSKGIEFPAADLDSMAPIHTPQKTANAKTQNISSSSVPITAPLPPVSGIQIGTSPVSVSPIGAAGGAPIRRLTAPLHLSPDQLAKLKSELDVVTGNMRVFNEMLNEMSPGHEHDDDWDLLSELHNTCQSMQMRIVELIEKVANEEVTNELLRINDEMNNLFLRFERYSKKRSPKGNQMPKAQPMQTQHEEPTLIDFTDDSAATVSNRLAAIQVSGISAAAGGRVETTAGDADFDTFAHTRSIANGNTNVSNVDLLTNENKPKDATNTQFQREQDFDEMEKWLNAERASEATNRESISSSEFDRFLAERASAVEKQPNVNSPNTKGNDH